MELEQQLAAALRDQEHAFWRMLLGDATPNWRYLEDLHACICTAAARYRQVHSDSRQSQLQNAWKYGLMAFSTNWQALERIDKELAELEQPSEAFVPEPDQDEL